MPLVVNNLNSKRAGVLNNLMETWRLLMPTYEKEQQKYVHTLSPSTLRTASYPFKESLPFPQYWPYGSERKLQTFDDKMIEISLKNYELSIIWNRDDETDDQLKDLRTQVDSCVRRYGMLYYILLSEYLTGVAVENPSLSLCYDGSDLISATDGDGNNRLGVSGGNLMTGSGLTVSGVIRDISRVQQRFLSFLDPTAGKPIFSPLDVAFNKMTVIGPKEANEVLMKASNSEYIRVDPLNNTSESNYLKSTFKFEINQFLTDSSDLFVLLEHDFLKPFAFRPPADITSIVADMSNSDHARLKNEFGIYTDVRIGIGPYFPGTIIKINN